MKPDDDDVIDVVARSIGEDGEAQDDAFDEDRLLQLARDAYSASTTYFDNSIRRDIELDLRQWQSLHSRNSKYYGTSHQGRSRLFRPKTRAAVLKSEAQAAEAFFSTMDVVNVSAYDKDDALQVSAARFFKALLQRRLTEPPPKGVPWYLTALGAFQETMVVGLAISKQLWEWDSARGRNRPMVDLLPVENFRFDPAADWRDPVNTSPYLVLLIPMYVRDVRQKIAQGKWRDVSDEELMTAVKKYSDSIRLQRETHRTDSADTSHTINEFKVVWVHENIIDVDGNDLLYYTLGDQVMLSDPEPVSIQYPQGRPFVVGFSTVEAHKHYPSSLPKLTRDVQREINDLANQRLDNVSFVLNKRYFVKRGVQVDLGSLMRNMPGSATLVNDPDKDVRVVETPDVTASSYNEQDRLNLDFDDVSGQFANSSVQSNRALNETVGGMNILTSNANQVGAYRLRTFVETWMEPVLRQLIELERTFEDDPMLIALCEVEAGVTQGAKMEMQAMGMASDANDIDHFFWRTPVQLNVSVGMGATNPQERANLLLFGFNAIKTLLADGVLEQRGLDAREVTKEIFGMLGYRDGSRFFRWGDEDPVVAQLQGVIEQLQRQLEAKIPPELLAVQVREMEEKVKRVAMETVAKGVQAAYAAMQAGQVIAAVPSVAPIADEVMKAAGWQPTPGQDPDFPQPAAPDPALTQGNVFDPRTGVQFSPQSANGPAGNPNPSQPLTPAQADAGMNKGIETPRADGGAQPPKGV